MERVEHFVSGLPAWGWPFLERFVTGLSPAGLETVGRFVELPAASGDAVRVASVETGVL